MNFNYFENKIMNFNYFFNYYFQILYKKEY